MPRRLQRWKRFLVALVRELKRDDVLDEAAAVTFFGILATFPFLLFLVSLASMVIDPAMAEELIAELGRFSPRDVTEILGERLRSLAARKSTGLLTFSGLLTLWTASGGIAALIRALNRTFGIVEKRPYWKVRGLALLVVIAATVLALASTLVTVVTPLIVGWLGVGWLGTLVNALRLPIGGLIVALIWAILLHFLPNTRQSFRIFSPGAIVGVLIWLAASWGFSLYVSNFGNYEVTYGALGGIIVMLIWMWLSVLAFLVGAEINGLLFSHPPPREP